MPTYKGNVGNLMQHWTLCELLNIAQDRGIPGLNFIDAHAMAPLARTKDSPDGRFNHVEARVQQPHEPDHEWASKYEWAWHHLAPSIGYPNSAVFVQQVWQGDFSLLLCEINGPTIAELGPWLGQMNSSPRCTNAELFPGDWRKRFMQPRGLPSPAEVGLHPESLTLVSFDPYWYDPTRDFDDGGNLCPNDMVRLLDGIENVNGRIIIQLSTYFRGHNNEAPQGVVIPQIDAALTTQGFADGTVVTVPLARGNGDRQDMMSLVYARGLDCQWLAQLQALPRRFTDWAQAIPA